ncbi:MAG: P-loop NTPase [Desulfovibrionaceae bacterium]
MSTFDSILPTLKTCFRQHENSIGAIRPLLLNRDLNGRVRIIVDEQWEADPDAITALARFAEIIHAELGNHAYPADQALLFEDDLASFIEGEATFPLEEIDNVFVTDRMAVESNWSRVSPTSEIPRIVFFSIKGGVGRSTALAAAAWNLAEQGKRVMVLDLDLESPGLSSGLLPEGRRPAFGITDWLVEDLVDNGDQVFESMVATSALSRNGEIFIVPAHGNPPGEYVAKLGRVWMPKLTDAAARESWSERLARLIDKLENRWEPDVVLIDSRAGIDEVASACITDIGASTILLFAIDGDQTWSGYRILFQHWRRTGAVRDIRERLQMVGAMIPELGTEEYFQGLLERAWDVCSEELYDEVPAGDMPMEDGSWNFVETDESAPHYPWMVRWHRGFSALRSLHGRFTDGSHDEVRSIFGPLIDGINLSVGVA